MRLFVTGTDTDIGKTVVTTALAASGPGQVCAAKPVASGTVAGQPPEDAARIAWAAQHEPRCFLSLEPAVSPHRALLMAGQSLSPSALESWVRDLSGDTVLVEGVGGWGVPIQVGDAPVWVRDLARWNDGPVVVVAGNRLGVLNHTRLTVDAVRADGFSVAGIVLNGLPGQSDESQRHNLADLQHLMDVPVVAFPVLDPTDRPALVRAGTEVWARLKLC